MAADWPRTRGILALQGYNVHIWTAADQCSITYEQLRLRLKADGDLNGLRELFEMANDRDALAALARENMGQSATIQTDM